MMTSPTLSLHNPYDFANPVNEREVFAGRTSELDEIKYYLDHTKSAPRPINLAIIGPRASGKTSLLNMIQAEADTRDFCTVRIDLDESDIESQLTFFLKVFDSIITRVCQQGAFSGITGKTYDTYRNMVDAGEILEDKTFCPFIFPLQYARAMSRGMHTVPVSDVGFKSDIALIQSVVHRPIILIFDECDVLAKSRVHLEKIRNIFMNSAGYMLVLSGTPSLFPAIDDVFSPIIRQFKKINVGPFEVVGDTRSCIEKPLIKAGIKNYREMFDTETFHDISEIHEITGGRPYEIQLICHFLFRRIQANLAKKMQLTVEVLDDVLKELESYHDVSRRSVINAVRSLSNKELDILTALCRCSGRATLAELWFLYYTMNGDEVIKHEDFTDAAQRLAERGVIVIDEYVRFAGDDFDRIYCKYFARQKRVPFLITEFPFEFAMIFELDRVIERISNIRSMSQLSVGSRDEMSIRTALESFDTVDGLDALLKRSRVSAEIVYWCCVDNRHSTSLSVATVVIKSGTVPVRTWYQWPNRHEQDASITSQFREILEEIQERSRRLNGDVLYEVEEVELRSVDQIMLILKQIGTDDFKRTLADVHMDRTAFEYLRKHNIDEAMFHSELMFQLSHDARGANNLGYLSLAAGCYPAAANWFELAEELHCEIGTELLLKYNKAILAILDQDIDTAKGLLADVITRGQVLSDEDREVLCLFKISGRGGNVELIEEQSPDLVLLAEEVFQLISINHDHAPS